MSKVLRSIYIEESVYEKAKEVHGTRGVSQAIENLLITQLFGLMFLCKVCGAHFSEKSWDRQPEKRLCCISCGASRINLEIDWKM